MISTSSNFYCMRCKKPTNHVETLLNGLIICGMCKSDIVGQKDGVHRTGSDHHYCTKCKVSYGGNRCINCALRMPEGELFYGTWHITYDPLTERMTQEEQRGK